MIGAVLLAALGARLIVADWIDARRARRDRWAP